VIVFLLLVSVSRPLYEPLVNGWLVVRVEPKVRATALSARDMFDSGGQIVGGPVIGAIGTAFTLRRRTARRRGRTHARDPVPGRHGAQGEGAGP